jgi:hypothetical protein
MDGMFAGRQDDMPPLQEADDGAAAMMGVIVGDLAERYGRAEDEEKGGVTKRGA